MKIEKRTLSKKIYAKEQKRAHSASENDFNDSILLRA